MCVHILIIILFFSSFLKLHTIYHFLYVFHLKLCPVPNLRQLSCVQSLMKHVYPKYVSDVVVLFSSK
jgi:hypothetical protein